MVWENGIEFARECECGKVRRDHLASKLKFAAIPKEFEGQAIANFRTDCYSTPQNRKLAEMAKYLAAQYVSQFPEIRKTGKGFYFYSDAKGSGKTRLAVSIANDLIAKHMVGAKFATTIQILDQIRNTWGKKSEERDMAEQTESERKIMSDIISVPVLVIDDIGVEQPKDWVKERFYSIINGRMNKKQVTIFTSNCRVDDLGLDGRIVDRIKKIALPVEFPAESIRSAIAGEENSAFMDCLLGR